MSRIFLKVKKRWVEALGAISILDAIQDGGLSLGVDGWTIEGMNHRKSRDARAVFRSIWESLHSGNYDPKMLVEAIEFERVY